MVRLYLCYQDDGGFVLQSQSVKGQVFRDRITTFQFPRKSYVIWKDLTLGISSVPILPAFAAAEYHNIDRSEICGMLHAIRNNIKGVI
jgi:hypothetical protein